MSSEPSSSGISNVFVIVVLCPDCVPSNAPYTAVNLCAVTGRIGGRVLRNFCTCCVVADAQQGKGMTKDLMDSSLHYDAGSHRF